VDANYFNKKYSDYTVILDAQLAYDFLTANSIILILHKKPVITSTSL